jgi:hypothetical protein
MSRLLKRAASLITLLIGLPLLATTSPVGAETPPEPGDAVPIEEAFTVAEGQTETGYGWPDISSDPVTGISLIVYNYVLDENLDGFDDQQVRARVVDSYGYIGTEIQVDTTLGSEGFIEFEPPTAAWNSTLEQWLVTWTDDEVVYGQIVDATGELVGSNFVIAGRLDGTAPDVNNNFDDIEQVEAEWSPDRGVYLVAFKALGTDGGVAFTQTILATLIDETGDWVLDGPAVDVSGEEANDGVTLAYSATTDVWLVGWERQATSELPGARIVSVSPSGAEFDIDFDTGILAVSTTGAGGGGAPDATWDSTRDRFIVIWRATQPGDATHQHYFNFIEPNGAFDEADEDRIGSELDQEAFRGRVAYLPGTDEYSVVSHLGDGGVPEQFEIRSWTITGEGASSDGEFVGDASTRQARPVVATGGGCFRYVWWDIGEFWGGDFDGLPDSVFAYLGCTGCQVFVAGSETFSDVTVGRFYDDPIGWLFATGLTTGTSPTTYEPERGVARGEFATFIWRYDGEPDAPAGSATFTDVTPGRFYDIPIGWFLQEGLTTGTSPTTYEPERILTRGELAAFLHRRAGSPDAPLGSATFTDVSPTRYYNEAIGWLFEQGLTTGSSPTTYEPERTLTRGEMATFLFRLAGGVQCLA